MYLTIPCYFVTQRILDYYFVLFYFVFGLQQNAEYLFKHSGGQYSALDMAQYVFWTGDEEGVAKAVEEFIRKGLVCLHLFIWLLFIDVIVT